jgi:hypothetical protein
VGAAVAYAAQQKPEPPVSGNRVKDRLVVVKDSGGTGHVVSKHNATFHLFNYNILDKYPLDAHHRFHIPDDSCEPFRIMSVSCSMPIEEFIEQLDCVKDAPPNYPRNQVGIAEVFDIGSGWFQVGSRFFLEESKSKLTIKETWGNSMGEADETRPRYIVRLP